jgi:hypothetical protein
MKTYGERGYSSNMLDLETGNEKHEINGKELPPSSG